ncbi:hypothetical protein GGR51DRAFT_454171 [Nemania sp. FL0031]|nr:hypothetical protein GGR51DRAFT_454171 [Nemania sp. FL0031]
MSEETTSEYDAATPESSLPLKEPSFHGRIQLKDFMFNGTSHTYTSSSSGMRRSTRLQSQSSQTSVSVSSESATPALLPGTPSELAPPTSTPRTTRKRKSQRDRSAAGPSTSTSTPNPSAKDDGAAAAPSPSPRKKRNRVASGYAPPSTYAHLPPLTDVITPNLLILFIGLNPGVQTARSGHAVSISRVYFLPVLAI